MQRTIYIRDLETWDGITDAAGLLGKSVSAYLVGLHEAFVEGVVEGEVDAGKGLPSSEQSV